MAPRSLGSLMIALVGSVTFLGGAGAAVANQAPVSPPAVTAQRAIVVDKLTGQALYEKNADSKALQGSVAKIMTAHVALWAARMGHVSLDDWVKISERAQAQGCACIQDLNNDNVSDVLVGTVFRLEDLLYALFMRSAGEATDAIAEHVASAIYFNKEPALTVDDSEQRMKKFVWLMNLHVSQLGLQNTTFVTVHGGDTCDFAIGCGPPHCKQGQACFGGTTPRDLATIWLHAAAEDARFVKLAGARSHFMQGSYSAQTSVGSYQAYFSYDLTKAFFYYPGVDGDKNGASPACQSCWIAQATRNGRTLVAVVQQSQSGAQDMGELFRYGFATVFNPDRRGDSGSVGAFAKAHALDCIGGTRAVSVIRTAKGFMRLILWDVNVDTGAIAKEASWAPLVRGIATGDVTDVDVAFLTNSLFVTSMVKGSSVQLTSWRVPATLRGTQSSPQLTQLKTSANLGGKGKTARVLRLSDTMILTAVRESTGVLRLKSWAVEIDGTITLLKDFGVVGVPVVKEFAIVSEWWGTFSRVVTAVRNNNPDVLRLHSWQIDLVTGDIKLLNSITNSSGDLAGSVRNISITRTLVTRFVTAMTLGTETNGSVKIILWKMDNVTGALTRSGDLGGTADQRASGTSIARLGTDVITGLQEWGSLRLVAWDVPKLAEGPVIYHDLASSDLVAGGGSKPRTCRLESAKATGDYAMAVLTAEELLQLSAWRVGEKP